MRKRAASLVRVLAPLLAFSAVGCSGAGDGTPLPVDADGPMPESAQRALRAVRANPALVQGGTADQFIARAVLSDPNGDEHVRLDRLYKGLPVLGGDVIVHGGSDGTLLGTSHTLRAPLDVTSQPRLSREEAVAVARAAAPGGQRDEGSSRLLIYARNSVQALAYEIVLRGELADESESELHVIVHALSGAVLESWDGIETSAAAGTGKGFFNGTVALTTNSLASGFELRDPSRGGQYTLNLRNKTNGGAIFTDADNVWGNFTLADAASVGVDAQYGTAATWDYFKNVHGRNGIANDGRGAYNRVHYGRKYNNAFWSDSCFCMTYGDGDGTTFYPFDSLDIAGHEMTHGVTSRTAGLIYSGESGGLNEATSDIFGTMVEYAAGNTSDAPDYLIGERIYTAPNKALRYMYRPSLDMRSPDCWSSSLGSLDVHYSSGVANHFFYLLAEGSAATPASPTCNGSSISGIGRAAAERIWYRALTVYFTSSTNYAAARVGSISAANDLYGAGSPQSLAVAAAWSAVNVN